MKQRAKFGALLNELMNITGDLAASLEEMDSLEGEALHQELGKAERLVKAAATRLVAHAVADIR